MNNHTKEKALSLLRRKMGGERITYADISAETGYGKRQLIRLAEKMEEGIGDSDILEHGNAGRKPSTTASEQEIEYIRSLKSPYKVITIAQFRDIYLEDVIRNPEKFDDVEKYGLRPRSATWFRQLFLREHWESPCMRDSLETGKEKRHPIRKPMESEGELVQIDGTPLDWFGDGRVYCLHNAMDDATSKLLAGYFMEAECTRGYCRVMKDIIVKHGRPRAIYSDRDTVFRSAKSGGPTQFSAMMDDLGIRMILALSPQAKGRVERGNETIQNRIVNDIIRFGIKDYDTLNPWYASFYIPYINAKFSYPARSPKLSYLPMDDGFDYSKVFRGRYKRVMHEDGFSYENVIYSCFSKEGELLHIQNGTEVNVFRDAFTDELYVERYGKRYDCVKMNERKRTLVEEAESEKKVDELLRNQRKK